MQRAEPDAGAGAEDGRVRRGARNREAIAEALIELVRGGDLEPTAEAVARRAGVGTRTVFRHFADMESLFAEIGARIEAEISALAGAPLPHGKRRARVAALVARRARAFERMAPFARSGAIQRHRSAFLKRNRAESNRRMRADMVQSLAPEIESAQQSRDANDLLEALDLVTSFEAWDRLRTDQRLGRERAEQVTTLAALALLATGDES